VKVLLFRAFLDAVVTIASNVNIINVTCLKML